MRLGQNYSRWSARGVLVWQVEVAEGTKTEVRRAHSRTGAAVLALYSRHSLLVIGAEGGGKA